MKLILTDYEKQKEALYKEVCADFTACKAEHPTATDSRIIRTIAAKHDMTEMGIRRILTAKGIYQRKR